MTSIFYPTISNYSTSTGVMPMLYAIRDSVPFSFDALLLVIYFILIVGQYFIVKNKTGRGKILTSILTASIVMTTLSLLLSLTYLVGYLEPVFYAFCSIIFFALYQLSDYW
jgi:hypothetical protein